LAGAFFRHRGLIALSAGGAVAEATLLSLAAPGARPVAAQVTALPPLAVYHDLRWLFVFNQSWLGFTAVLALLLVARSALDTVLLMLAWPAAGQGVPRPRFGSSFLSCAVLTLLVGLVMSPVVTLMFGVALLPFSWPYLAAMPILLGTALALSQGGVGRAWWRRLPPARTAAWLLTTFAVLSLASVLTAHLDTPGIVAVAGLAGLVDARAWYGLTAAAVRRLAEESSRGGSGGTGPPRAGGPRGVVPRGLALLPVAPLAAVLVLALVVALARLAFTGTVRFVPAPAEVAGNAVASAAPPGPAAASGAEQAHRTDQAVLVVAGFGSTCCHSADGLRESAPGLVVRQFSYLGLDARGQPVPYGGAAGNISIQVLGDRMATQVARLYRQTHAPVDVVAESEGTLGLYAMLARHPQVPVGSVVLLSPIFQPGQVGQAGQAGGTVPGQLLSTLNNLVGGMSPYGSAGAQALIDSVSQVGASYFAMVSRDRGRPWLAVVPLADAVTLPACSWPRNVVFVDAFHGGLLGNASVQQMVAGFLADGISPPSFGDDSQARLRREAQLIAAASAAWRMPQLHPECSALPAGGTRGDPLRYGA
jgi:hypothetical protein